MKRQVLLFIGTLMISGLSHATEPSVRSGSGTADHEALASRYEQEARIAEEKVHQYRKTIEWYKQHGNKVNATLATHFDQLAREYEKDANESFALAKQHREQAMAQR